MSRQLRRETANAIRSKNEICTSERRLRNELQDGSINRRSPRFDHVEDPREGVTVFAIMVHDAPSRVVAF